MPLYDYECTQCGERFEQLVPIDLRNVGLVVCPICGTVAKLVIATPPKLGKERYQMKAVLSDGQHVAGHFGKSAPLYKGGKR